METYIESRKRSHMEDRGLDLEPWHVTPHDPHEEDGPTSATPPPLSRTHYPNVKYWTREEWNDAESKKSNSSDPLVEKAGTSTRGKTLCAQGVNVCTKFIEHSNGKPITGTQAAEIREYARSLWKDLYISGLAPRTWGEAPRSIQDKYSREMEKQWEVLRYCENSWKAQHLATKTYSQWYTSFHRKMTRRQLVDAKTKEPARKKHKTSTKEDDHGDFHSDPEETDLGLGLEDSNEGNIVASSSLLEGDISERPARHISRPKPRPLRDPL